jgi:excisionase family DNA binding protein
MELLSVKEAAERAGVTSKAIYYSISHGKLTAHKKYGRVLVDALEVDKYSPRAISNTRSGPVGNQRLLTGRGFLAQAPGSTEEFMARKVSEKALER